MFLYHKNELCIVLLWLSFKKKLLQSGEGFILTLLQTIAAYWSSVTTFDDLAASTCWNWNCWFLQSLQLEDTAIDQSAVVWLSFKFELDWVHYFLLFFPPTHQHSTEGVVTQTEQLSQICQAGGNVASGVWRCCSNTTGAKLLQITHQQASQTSANACFMRTCKCTHTDTHT